MIDDPVLNYFALGLLIFVVIVIFYAIIAIHDIPYLIAKKREHPHQDAIHAAGWVSLFTLHAMWPFLWVLNGASRLVLRLLRLPAPDHAEGSLSIEELRILIAPGTYAAFQRPFSRNRFSPLSKPSSAND